MQYVTRERQKGIVCVLVLVTASFLPLYIYMCCLFFILRYRVPSCCKKGVATDVVQVTSKRMLQGEGGIWDMGDEDR